MLNRNKGRAGIHPISLPHNDVPDTISQNECMIPEIRSPELE
jgi:hypothetical protein